MKVSSYTTAMLLVSAVVVTLASALLAYDTALQNGLTVAGDMNARRLQIFDRTLQANIERYHYLPSIIAQAAEMRELLENPLDDSLRAIANGYLSDLNSTANSDELFIVDVHGTSVAASNWWSHTSLVGGSYGSRPYFEEAMLDGAAQYYAVGLTTGVPGYFLATRIDGPDGPLGVAVVKVNLGEIEAVWWRSGELIAILDQNEVAILSTRPDWRYRSLKNLRPAQVSELNADQSYVGVTIGEKGIVDTIVDWRRTELAVLRNTDSEISGEFVVERLRLPAHGWLLLSFTPLGPIASQASTAAAIVAFAVAAFLSALGLYHQRHRLIQARLEDHEQLEERVKSRTSELQLTNQRLNKEVLDRQRAEQGLVQAAKMASLGQALAGVAHEVSQPLAALRTQISSARILAGGGQPMLLEVIDSMEAVVRRMAGLTGHLKTFSRKETEISIRSDLVHILQNALELSRHLVDAGRLVIEVEWPDRSINVVGNPIHIEQVLINLISNAADAMEDVEKPLLRIGFAVNERENTIAFTDIGTGIEPEVAETLFDPFVTTKAPGRGLGLGLSISFGLMVDIGGRLEFQSIRGAGSTFNAIFPIAFDEGASRTAA